MTVERVRRLIPLIESVITVVIIPNRADFPDFVETVKVSINTAHVRT